MAATAVLFVKGIIGMVSIAIAILLVFVNDIITKPLNEFILAADYGGRAPIGMDMIPVIQWSIVALCVAVGIICLASVWIEVFAEVAYEPGY
jgi:hypothetical protein